MRLWPQPEQVYVATLFRQSLRRRVQPVFPLSDNTSSLNDPSLSLSVLSCACLNGKNGSGGQKPMMNASQLVGIAADGSKKGGGHAPFIRVCVMWCR